MPRPAGRASLLATLFFTILIGFLPIATSERSSSERSPALDAAEIFRDAPLYPPLQDAPLYAFQDAPLYPLRDAPQYPVQGADQTSTDLHTLQTLTDTNLEPKFNFQPFFDTNNEDESVEVIETEPETNIEESIVIPDETVLPETKDKRVYDSEPIGTDTQTPNNNEDVDNLFNNLTDETNLDLSDDNILDKDEYAPRKKSRIDDLLAEVEVEEENDEYKAQETSVSDAVMREILGGEEEDTERTKRSAGQDWDKSKTRRIKTGDTILNIRGAVRDGIGDAGAAPGTRASSRVDAFVIRPAALSEQPPPPPPPPQPPGDTRDRTQKQERELLVEAHARARVACDLHNVTGLRWYRDNEIVNLASSPTSSEGVWREGDAVVVARATRALAGRWRCAGRDRAGRAATGQPTRLMIYEPVRAVYLAVDGRRLDAGNTWVPVRDRADLTVRCVAEGGVPPPELSWRLMALEPTFDHKPYLRINPTNYSIEGVWWSRVSLTAARELHNATLQCTARQRSPSSVAAPATAAPAQHLTAKLEIHVTYPPSFVISRWPGFGVALWAGGAAALRCDVDANPPARAAWTRHDRAPSSLAPVEEGGAGEAATLRWAVLRASHAGWYRCRARWGDIDYYSIGYYLNVLSADESHTTETQPEVEEPDHQKVEVPLGGNVQLHCPKGSVGCWWRRVVGNASDAWAPAGSHHAHGVLGIKEAVYEEGGEYRCVGARAPDLQRLRELKRVTLAVTGGATATAISAEPVAGGWKLVCGACGRNLRVLWLRGGRSTPAILSPDLAQHCWRAVLALPEPDEVWCVAAASTGGAVAVFPRRTAPSPAPARHAVRALHSSAFKITSSIILLATCTLF